MRLRTGREYWMKQDRMRENGKRRLDERERDYMREKREGNEGEREPKNNIDKKKLNKKNNYTRDCLDYIR